MSTINIDKDVRAEKLRILLHYLSLGRLDRENAVDLRNLLIEELKSSKEQNDIDRESELSAFIKILDAYISGEVDLMVNPNKIISVNITENVSSGERLDRKKKTGIFNGLFKRR